MHKPTIPQLSPHYSPLGLPVTTTYATGDVVTNYYDFNRLDSTKYSRLPKNDVRYKYNQYGRVSEIQDGSGKQMLNYDELGNISEQIRTFAIPNASNTYTFRMLFNYDWEGELQSAPEACFVKKFNKSVAGFKNSCIFASSMWVVPYWL